MNLINVHTDGRVIYTFCRDDSGKRVIKKVEDFYPYYFEPDFEGSYKSFTGEPLRKIIVSDPRSIAQNRSPNAWEADIPLDKRYVIDRVNTITKCPIRYCFIDIETLSKDFPDVKKANDPVSCISVWDSFTKKITTFYLGDYGNTKNGELKLLMDFVEHIRGLAPDIWNSWNVSFDFTYLTNRFAHFSRVPFAEAISPIGQSRYGGRDNTYPAGISIVDYLTLYKLIFKGLVSYSLDSVLEHEFGRGKQYAKVDFGTLSETLKLRNIGDVQGMVRIDDKHSIIDHYNEVRMMSKVFWEDFSYYCLDEKTEILTNRGWKKYNEINTNQKVYSLNPFTYKLEKVSIDDIFIYEYNNEMVKYSNNRIDFCVTPQHRFLMYQKRKERNKNGLIVEFANSIPLQRRYFIIGSEGYDGDFDGLTDEQIKLLGWIIAEGHFEKSSNAVLIYQKEGPRSKEIASILKSLKLNFRISRRQVNLFRIPACEATPYRVLLNSKKQLPPFVYNLKVRQKRILIDTLMKGDGHWVSETSGCYYSADKALIEQFQQLAILAGWNSYITVHDNTINNKTHTIYHASLVTHKFRGYNHEKKSIESYSGKVWCISNAYQNFLIRRNNRIVLSGNSRAIDMLLLSEAHKKSVALPMKPRKVEGVVKEKFEGAFREIYKKGRLEKVGQYDIAGCYMNIIMDLALDTANIVDKSVDGVATIPVTVTDRTTQEVTNTYLVKQDPNALLPAVIGTLLRQKNKLKKLKNETNPELPEYESIERKYMALKALVLSSWGNIGNEYFRVFDHRVASMITATARDVLHYIKNELEKRGYPVVYIDTDSVTCADGGKNIVGLLNELVQQWSQDRFGKDSSIEFEFEGNFETLILLQMCRYKGWLRTPEGKLKIEIKGIESRRKDSTTYLKSFQTELLEKIKDKVSQSKIVKWINNEIANLPNQPLVDVAFPCRLGRKVEDYVSVPIFIRALNNTPGFTRRVGENFFYIFVNSDSYEMKIIDQTVIMTYDKDGKEKGFKNITDKRLEMACEMNDAQGEDLKKSDLIKTISVEKKGKLKDIVAFDSDNVKGIKEKVNWTRMVERNIINKITVIFEAMGWDLDAIKKGAST